MLLNFNEAAIFWLLAVFVGHGHSWTNLKKDTRTLKTAMLKVDENYCNNCHVT